MAERVTILLVEDNPGDERLLMEVVKDAGTLALSVEIRRDLESALKSAEALHPDIVLLDLNLPDSKGLFTFLRFRQSLPRLPVVVLTGIEDEELGVQAVKEGAEDFLTKADLSPRLLARSVRYAIERHDLRKRLQYCASHDALTGVFNRQYFKEMIEVELARSRRYQHAIGILMLDIDGFKAVNDQIGHEAGDRVLRAVADFLVREMRTVDTVIRYGGDEFLLILPETGQGVEGAAQRLREASAAGLRDVHEDLEEGVSVSIGASYWEEGRQITLDEAIAEADQRMYARKRAKRS